jgi:hypothetical protein
MRPLPATTALWLRSLLLMLLLLWLLWLLWLSKPLLSHLLVHSP